MTREDSILNKIWVTNDGRYLTVDEITDDHLHNIRFMLCQGMTPGYAQVQDCYTIEGPRTELTQDEHAAAWIQIIADEFTRRCN